MITKKELKALEIEILQKFDAGNYSPLGADGGCLKYILTGAGGYSVHAEITQDEEIAKIRRIWQLSLDDKEIYNFKKDYYKLRN